MKKSGNKLNNSVVIKSQSTEGDVTKEKDPWGIVLDNGDYVKWKDMTSQDRLKSVLKNSLKIVLVVGCLYFFICSLSLMGSSFQILAGKTAGSIFENSKILSNPITGLIIGILVTVLVQSSSTSTSIITTMVAAGIIQVHDAIPMVMGANIGTSVTNTIVSLTQSIDVQQFRRSFAGATVHDIFNILSVLIFLPLEVASGYLEKMTNALVRVMLKDFTESEKPPDILKVVTNPLTKKIVQVNKTVIQLVARGVPLQPEASMVKTFCGKKKLMESITNQTTNETVNVTISIKLKCDSPSDFLFADTGLSDGAVGAILLVISLVVLCFCLIMLVKLLSSMLRGSVAIIIKKVINTDFPYPFAWFTGYLAILVGAGLTVVVQSSSVFTSTMTPLVGIGVISLDRMYPLTLGSNIGTTTTSILAALASDPDMLHNTLQIAFCHFFFNISGILVWYPVPIMRRVPIRGAKFLGNTTAKYRWFAVVYLLLAFFFVPALLLGLTLAQVWAMGAVLIVIGVILLFVIVLNVLQNKATDRLPRVLRTWMFLPLFMRSLKPYDVIIVKMIGVCRCCKKHVTNDDVKDVEQNGNDVMAMGEVNEEYEVENRTKL